MLNPEPKRPMDMKHFSTTLAGTNGLHTMGKMIILLFPMMPQKKLTHGISPLGALRGNEEVLSDTAMRNLYLKELAKMILDFHPCWNGAIGRNPIDRLHLSLWFLAEKPHAIDSFADEG